MGLLDGLLNEVTSCLSGAASQQTGLTGSILNMLANQPGGIQGLIQQAQANGLGGVVNSWIGTGPNQPINPQQIEQLLGNEKLQQLAAQHGLDIEELKSHLAQILPCAVDKLTPNGQPPDGNALGGVLNNFLGGNR